MVLLQQLHIDTRLVIISFRKSAAHNLHQVLIALVILRKQHQMVITILPAGQLFIKPGIRCNIDLTPKNRINALCLACLIKINHAIHDSMIRDGCTVHAKLLDTLHIFFNFIGSI